MRRATLDGILKRRKSPKKKEEQTMACFLVPTAEAIVTGVVSKVEKKN